MVASCCVRCERLLRHLFSASILPQVLQRAHSTWPPANGNRKLTVWWLNMWEESTAIRRERNDLRPLTGLRSSHGCGPCYPARFCVVQACWRTTWRGCTAGPPASLGLSRVPSSGPWPSGLFWCASSGLSRPMGRPCSVEEDTQQLHTIWKECFNLEDVRIKWTLFWP